MRSKKCIFFVLCFLLPDTGGLTAQENILIIEEREKNNWYKPDYFKIQYAGNIGFISLGLGYDWWRNIIQTDMLYGYVPKYKGNASVHTFTIKNTFRLYQFNIKQKFNISPIVGFSISLEPGENSYLHVPDKYPNGYYSTNSFYACLNAGLKTNFKLKEKRHFSSVDLYCEVNTLADYVYYNIIAKEDWEDNILSLALGLNVFF